MKIGLAAIAITLVTLGLGAGCGEKSQPEGGDITTCLQDESAPCLVNEDCAGGHRCNLALAQPQCMKLFCLEADAPCSSSEVCHSEMCGLGGVCIAPAACNGEPVEQTSREGVPMDEAHCGACGVDCSDLLGSDSASTECSTTIRANQSVPACYGYVGKTLSACPPATPLNGCPYVTCEAVCEDQDAVCDPNGDHTATATFSGNAPFPNPGPQSLECDEAVWENVENFGVREYVVGLALACRCERVAQ